MHLYLAGVLKAVSHFKRLQYAARFKSRLLLPSVAVGEDIVGSFRQKHLRHYDARVVRQPQ